jgi:hypothetical protein
MQRTIEEIGESTMTKTLHGKVRGNLIELDEDLGLAEGQEVEITLRTVRSVRGRRPGEGFLRTEGALDGDQEWDEIMEQIHQDRKRDTRREIAE